MDQLSDAFFSAGGAPGDGIERRIAALVEAGRSAFPEVRLAPEDFARHLGACARDLSAELRADELWLACACARGDAAALAIFSGRYLARLPEALARIDSAPAFVDEVLQLVRERLLVPRGGEPARIAEYRGHGSLEGWVRVTATRIALRLRRRLRPDAPGSQPLESAPDRVQLSPELEYLRERYRPEFAAALRASLAALPVRPRTVLRMHYLDGLSIDRLGEHFRVHRATAARWITAARQQLLQATRERLKERLRVDDPELDSLVRAVASQLDVSLAQLAAE
jgi:RNA polymerase sigma-70 factor (ECF subfamily)